VPVELALGDENTHGERGEGDSLTTIENILSGSAGDRLTGDNYDNDIVAGAGDDLLRGGLGGDRLLGGRGVDSVFCGGGADVAFVDVRRDFVQRDCEEVTWSRPGVRYTARPYPRGLKFRLGCPVLVRSCSGRLTLRETRGRTRLVATGKISKRSRAKTVKVKLTSAGRKLAGRRGGVLTTVTLKGRGLPSVGWTIRFRR
jgi:Ca2+-binding RTX toxin-like protein